MQGALDSFHKAVSPDTYPCKLCALTHGYIGMRDAWRKFLKNAMEHGYQFKALHKDEIGDWPFNFDELPGVYLLSHGTFEKCMGRTELDQIRSLDELIHELEQKLHFFNTSESSRIVSGIR